MQKEKIHDYTMGLLRVEFNKNIPSDQYRRYAAESPTA